MTTSTTTTPIGTTQATIINKVGTEKLTVSQIAAIVDKTPSAVRNAILRMVESGFARVARTDKATGIKSYTTTAAARKAVKTAAKA